MSDTNLNIRIALAFSLALLPNGARTKDLNDFPCATSPGKCKSVDLSTRITLINLKVENPTASATNKNVWWRYQFSAPSVRFTRYHFKKITRSIDADYSIQFFDASGQIVASYGKDLFERRTEFSTGLLPGGDLEVLLVSPTKPSVSFTLERVTWPEVDTSTTPEGLVPAWRSLNDPGIPEGLRRVAPAIVLLHIGPEEAHCSGAMISSHHVVTNYHCIVRSLEFLRSAKNLISPCTDVLVEFDYNISNSRGQTAMCEVATGSEKDDLAVLSLYEEQVPLVNGVVRKPLEISNHVSSAQDASVLHYPLGLPLAAQAKCSIRLQSTDDLQHDCSTVSGSSGAPILDAKQKWIGVHYMGPFPSDWTVARIEERLKSGPVYNHARPISLIETLTSRFNKGLQP